MEEHTPVWVLSVAGAVASLVAVGYAIVRFFFHVRERQLEFQSKRLAHDKLVREDEVVQHDADRRSEAAEAWEVVDRLTAELENVNPRIEALQEKCDRIKEECDRRERDAVERATRCETDHAGTKRLLRFVIAWGRTRGMKLDPRLEQELERSTDGDSSPHTPLPVVPPPPQQKG